MKKLLMPILVAMMLSSPLYALGTSQRYINVYPETYRLRDEACKQFGNLNAAYMPWNFQYQVDGMRPLNIGPDGKPASLNYVLDANGQKIPLQLCSDPEIVACLDASRLDYRPALCKPCYDPSKPSYDPAGFNACSKAYLGF